MLELDPVQFGSLIKSVETLANEVQTLRGDVKELASQITGGRGVITGIIIAAGGIGAGMHHLLDKLIGDK
jgi:hypothetical protein